MLLPDEHVEALRLDGPNVGGEGTELLEKAAMIIGLMSTLAGLGKEIVGLLKFLAVVFLALLSCLSVDVYVHRKNSKM